jgi:hypothetical protein
MPPTVTGSPAAPIGGGRIVKSTSLPLKFAIPPEPPVIIAKRPSMKPWSTSASGSVAMSGGIASASKRSTSVWTPRTPSALLSVYVALSSLRTEAPSV